MEDRDTRVCPYCAETIKYGAIKCRHCGSDLQRSPDSVLTTSQSNALPQIGIGAGDRCQLTRDIIIDNEVAFHSQEIVVVEKVVPNPQKPDYKYVVLSKNLQKRFQLSDVNLRKSPASCSNCGKSFKDGTRFCPYCGTGLQIELSNQVPSSAGNGVTLRPPRQETHMASPPVTPRGSREAFPTRQKPSTQRQSRPKMVIAIVTIGCLLLVISLTAYLILGGNRSWIDMGEAGSASNLLTSLASNGTNLYAAGDDGQVYRYDGTSWKDTGGPAGGNIDCLVCGGTNLYAGTEGPGVYRYDGSTWTDISRPRDMYPSVICLAWNGTYLYAGGSSDLVYCYDGNSWTDTGGPGSRLGGGEGYVHSLTCNSTNLYAGVENGLVYRYDGTSWTDTGGPALGPDSWPYGAEAPGGVWSLSSNGTSLYAGVGNGHVYRYDGTSWTDLGDLDRPEYDEAISSVASNGTSLFAAVEDYHVYRYSGSTWADTGGPVGKTKDAPGANSLVWNGTNLYAGCSNGRVYRYGGGH